MRFFELAQKLKLSHEELCQWLRDEAVVNPETPDADIDPFMTLSNEDVFNIVADFTDAKEPKGHQARVSSIGISHFKAFGSQEQQIPLKPLTFVFGPNSAGKSSFLHSLLWAEDAFQTGELDVIRPRLSGDMVDLGGIRNVVYRKGADGNTFSLRFTFPPSQQTQPLVATIGEGKTVHLELAFDAGLISEESASNHVLDLLTQEGEMVSPLNDQPFLTRYALYLNDSETPFLRLSKRKGGHFAVNNLAVDDAAFLDQWMQVQTGFTFSEKVSDFEHQVIDRILSWVVAEMRAEADEILPVRASFAGAAIDVEEALVDLLPSSEAEESSSTYHEPGEIVEDYAYHHEDDEYEPDQSDHEQVAGDWEPELSDVPSADEIFNEVFLADQFDETARQVQLYVETTIQTLIAECSGMTLDYLGSLVYLGSQRAYPERGFTFTSKRDANWKANGGEAWDRLAKDKKLRQRVNSWLQDENHLKAPYKLDLRLFVDVDKAALNVEETLEDEYSEAISGEADLSEYTYNEGDEENSRVELLNWDSEAIAGNIISSILHSHNAEKLKDLYLVDTRSETIVSHRDVGVGISQIIPILATAMSLEGKTIAIEEPESHLHPRAQAELADVFIESALVGENPNSFIVETHSETLLLRVLRRIRESSFKKNGDRPKITADDIAFVYIDPLKGGAKAMNVRIDERGRVLDNLPDGFFEEGFDELFGG